LPRAACLLAQISQKLAFNAIQLVRSTFDKVTGYGEDMNEAKWLQRMLFLVRGVCGCAHPACVSAGGLAFVGARSVLFFSAWACVRRVPGGCPARALRLTLAWGVSCQRPASRAMPSAAHVTPTAPPTHVS
jgi:hypothetical protein